MFLDFTSNNNLVQMVGKRISLNSFLIKEEELHLKTEGNMGNNDHEIIPQKGNKLDIFSSKHWESRKT